MSHAKTERVWPVPGKSTSRVVFWCWLAILAEGYDVGVMGAVIPTLKEYKPWSLSMAELGVLGSFALVGMMIGAMVIGTISDRVGRKRMLLVSVAVFSLAQLGAALAPTPLMFGIFRMIGGLGMGGIIPVAAALTIEYSPPKKRSFNYGVMYSGYSLGILAAALVAFALSTVLGWRWVVAVGALPVFLVPILAKALPESVESLLTRGLDDKARDQARRLHIEPFIPSDWRVVPVEQVEKLGVRHSIATMFSRDYVRSTIGFWIALFSGLLLVYGLNTWLPSIMKQAGYQLGSALMFLAVFSLSSAIGGLVIGRLADLYGKRTVLVIFYLAGALGIVLLMIQGSLWVNYVFVAFAGIGTISTSLVLTAWVADHYPPQIRATATGWALSFARIGAISGPIIGGWIAQAGVAFAWNFIIFAAIGVVAAAAVLIVPKRAPVRLVTGS